MAADFADPNVPRLKSRETIADTAARRASVPLHRLPLVDDEGSLLGTLDRSDVVRRIQL